MIPTSFIGNMISDLLTAAAVFGGGWLASQGFFPGCTQAQVLAHQCTTSEFNGYLGSVVFLGGLLYKFVENKVQATRKS